MLRRLIVGFAWMVLTAISLAQAPVKPPGGPDKTKEPPGNCVVSGRVVGAADGAPLCSARVGLVQQNVARHPLVYATTTGEQGHFEIKQAEAGRYDALVGRRRAGGQV